MTEPNSNPIRNTTKAMREDPTELALALDRRRQVLQQIVRDVQGDVERFEGAPFNGRVVSEYLGGQAAAIAALARITETLLPGTISAGGQIFRHDVPVDGEWHMLEIGGDPLHVGARHIETVEFWAPTAAAPPAKREFRIYGTGHVISEDVRYWGTVVVGPFVWHLVERVAS